MSATRLSIFALAAVSLAFGAQAQALDAKQTVQKEVTVQQEDGTTITKLVSADLVTPGEKIVYTVSYTNDDAKPATDLVLAMPVPANVRFQEGSADRDGAVVRYSTDGGSTFSERESLTLPTVGGGTRSANSDDITDIQWRIAGPVAVGSTDSIRFMARLK